MSCDSEGWGEKGISERVNGEILGREIKGIFLLTKVSHGLGKFEKPYNRSKYCDIGKKLYVLKVQFLQSVN